MKKNIIFFALGFVLAFLLPRQCTDKKTIVTKPKIGSFETQTNIQHQLIEKETLQVPKWYKDTKKENELNRLLTEREERIKLYQEEVAWMQEEFAYMDSLQKANAYKEATALNSFNSDFEDDFLKLTIQGIVQGKVKEITPFYTIKPQKIDVPSNDYRRILIGAGFGTNTINTTYKINLGYQNKKGNILRGSYQKINQQHYGLIEYDFSLIKF